MKRKWAMLIGPILVVLMFGCSMNREVIKEQASDHSHVYPNVKAAGDYHVRGFMNRKTREIGIQVLDRYEEAFYLEYVEKIKAEITKNNGQVKTIWLHGRGYTPPAMSFEEYYGQAGATEYYQKFDWIAKPHNITLKVWVPLPDDKLYELAFQCKAQQNMPQHSGIITN